MLKLMWTKQIER